MRNLLNNSLFLSIQVCKKIADPQTQAYVPVSSERGGGEGERFIILQLFSQVFDVVAKEDVVDDAAYSLDDLIMHMDQGYFESSPGIQVLHCLK